MTPEVYASRGFVSVRCGACGDHVPATWLCQKCGLCPDDCRCR